VPARLLETLGSMANRLVRQTGERAPRPRTGNWFGLSTYEAAEVAALWRSESRRVLQKAKDGMVAEHKERLMSCPPEKVEVVRAGVEALNTFFDNLEVIADEYLSETREGSGAGPDAGEVGSAVPRPLV